MPGKKGANPILLEGEHNAICNMQHPTARRAFLTSAPADCMLIVLSFLSGLPHASCFASSAEREKEWRRALPRVSKTDAALLKVRHQLTVCDDLWYMTGHGYCAFCCALVDPAMSRCRYLCTVCCRLHKSVWSTRLV